MIRKQYNYVLLILLVLTPLTAIAQSTYTPIERRLTAEQLRATDLDTLSPVQLEILNRLLREHAIKTVSTPVVNAKQAHTVTAGFIGLDATPIKSRLIGSIGAWAPEIVFELENGQQWKVLKGRAKLRKTLESTEITLVSGLAGR